MSLIRTGCLLLAAALPAVSLAGANSFNFDILYLGDDQAALAPGSDEPDGATLLPGDCFEWTITATDERFWFVETENSFFPLMAFAVDTPADYVGDYQLSLRNNGAEVFSESMSGVLTSQVHVGTNAVTLPTGLAFDEMFLSYDLISVDPLAAGDPSEAMIRGRLPIFGAPENNGFDIGIVFIPEPTSLTLVAAAALLSSLRSRPKC